MGIPSCSCRTLPRSRKAFIGALRPLLRLPFQLLHDSQSFHLLKPCRLPLSRPPWPFPRLPVDSVSQRSQRRFGYRSTRKWVEETGVELEILDSSLSKNETVLAYFVFIDFGQSSESRDLRKARRSFISERVRRFCRLRLGTGIPSASPRFDRSCDCLRFSVPPISFRLSECLLPSFPSEFT